MLVATGQHISFFKKISTCCPLFFADILNGKQNTKFSALCWLYGRMIYEQLQYPIGLIASTWPGTQIQVWSSTDALNMCNNSRPLAPL